MKIICFGTLDKFSRFYLDIGKEVSKRDGELRTYAIHFSGFLYTLIRLKFSSWISLKSWILVFSRKKSYTNIISNQSQYKGVSIDDCIAYHRDLSNLVSVKNLRLQTLAYIDIIESIYEKYQPNKIICLGDTRMCIQVAIALAKRMNVEVQYIEQGPFGRTFFDDQGVNANLSVRALADLQSSPINDSFKTTSRKYLRSPLYRLFDIGYMKLLENTVLYPPDLKHTDVFSFRLKKKSSSIYKRNGHRILLICQLPADVNSIMHSPLYKSQTELIRDIHSNLPSDCYLVIREHPLFLGKYSKDFYKYINSNGIEIENHSPLDSAIFESQVIVVNNSTVGFESICQYKSTVVLGNAFYDREGLCLKLKDKSDLKRLLGESLSYAPDKTQIDIFKNHLFSTVLIKGGISDHQLVASKTINQSLFSKL